MASNTSNRPSDLVAAHVRLFRRQLDWTAADLAERCKRAGFAEITQAVIANIESGRRDEDGRRRRDVTADEITAFAVAFGITPAGLLASALNHPPETAGGTPQGEVRLHVTGSITVSLKDERQ